MPSLQYPLINYSFCIKLLWLWVTFKSLWIQDGGLEETMAMIQNAFSMQVSLKRKYPNYHCSIVRDNPLLVYLFWRTFLSSQKSSLKIKLNLQFQIQRWLQWTKSMSYWSGLDFSWKSKRKDTRKSIGRIWHSDLSSKSRRFNQQWNQRWYQLCKQQWRWLNLRKFLFTLTQISQKRWPSLPCASFFG